MINDLFPRTLDFPRLSPLRNHFWSLLKALSRLNWVSSAACHTQKVTPATSFSLQWLGQGPWVPREQRPLQLLASSLKWVTGNTAEAWIKEPVWQVQGPVGDGGSKQGSSEITSGSSRKCHAVTEGAGACDVN